MFTSIEIENNFTFLDQIVTNGGGWDLVPIPILKTKDYMLSAGSAHSIQEVKMA